MAENENVNEPAFVLNQPEDGARRTYSLPVKFHGYPQMWFKNPDDAHDVLDRLQKNESPEYIQSTMVSGQNSITPEYTAKLKITENPVSPWDNFNLVNVPGEIVDLTPQTRKQTGSVWYKDNDGALRRRETHPEMSSLGKGVRNSATGASGAWLGGKIGSRWGVVGEGVGTVVGGVSGYVLEQLRTQGQPVPQYYDMVDPYPADFSRERD